MAYQADQTSNGYQQMVGPQGLQGPCQSIKKVGELGEVLNNINRIVTQLDNAAGRISASLDRLHGTRPTATEANAKVPTPASNTLSEMRDRLNFLDGVAHWLEDSANRLDSIA